MTRYELMQIGWNTGGVIMISTDSLTMEKVLNDLKGIMPKYRFAIQQALPTGETLWYYIKNLGGKDREICWWIIREFCRQGWEPLSSHLLSAEDNPVKEWMYFYDFKLKVEN